MLAFAAMRQVLLISADGDHAMQLQAVAGSFMGAASDLYQNDVGAAASRGAALTVSSAAHYRMAVYAVHAMWQVQQLSGGQQLELEVVQLLTQRLQTLGPPPEGLHPQQPGGDHPSLV